MFKKKMSDSSPEEVADIELGLIRAERRVSEAFDANGITMDFDLEAKNFLIKHIASQRFRLACMIRGMRSWSLACHEMLAKWKKEKNRADHFEKLCKAYESKIAKQ